MANTDIFRELESEVQSYARAFPTVFDRASGAEIFDIKGRRYIDFLAGAGSLNYGHNDRFCTQALLSYIEHGGIAHSLDLHTSSKGAFLEALKQNILQPRGLDYVVQFPGPTGANAVEAALKLARKVTGRTDIVCFTNAFHGVTLGALAATGASYFRDAAGVSLTGVTRMPYDGYLGADVDTLDYFEKTLHDPSSGIDDPAAVIVETVQGEGGLNVASRRWLERLAGICRDNDIILIVDDIQAGCGRTGTFFSFENYDFKPDMVLLSKSLSAYGLPMSVVLLDPGLDEWQPGEHNGTFRGNNHAFVTARAALENYWQDDSFGKKIQSKSKVLDSRLTSMVDRFPDHFDGVVGRGMMQGIACKNPDRAGAITSSAFASGLIVERSGAHDQVIKCMAPLTIDVALLFEGLDILESAIEQEFTRSKSKEPLRQSASVSSTATVSGSEIG